MIGLIIKSDIEPRIQQVCNTVLKGLIINGTFKLIKAELGNITGKDVVLAKEVLQEKDINRVCIVGMRADMDSELIKDVLNFNTSQSEVSIGINQYYEEIFPKLSLDMLMEVSQQYPAQDVVKVPLEDPLPSFRGMYK